jgi:hypothetical protein
MTPPYLQEHLEEIRGIDVEGHSIAYSFENWRDILINFSGWNGFADLFDHQKVSRRQLFQYSVNRNLEAQVIFVATMAWGYGYAGYGPWRTAQGLKQNAN